jgi:DNA-binding protein HU-beta
VVSDPAPAAAVPRRQAGSAVRKPQGQARTAQAKSRSARSATAKFRSAEPATAKRAAAKPKSRSVGAVTPKRPAATGRSAPTAGAATIARAATTGRTAPTARAATTGRTARTTRAATAPAASDDRSSTPAHALRSPAIPEAMATRPDALGTAVQAAAELAEIGLTVWARTLRNALSHLPRP